MGDRPDVSEETGNSHWTGRREIAALRAELAEAREALTAIRAGQVDAVVVEGPEGPRVFSLDGADTVYRQLLETLGEGAMTVSDAGRIVFCNSRIAELIGRPLEELIGRDLLDFVAPEEHLHMQRLLSTCRQARLNERIVLSDARGGQIPVLCTGNSLPAGGPATVCLVLADLRELENATSQIEQLRKVQADLSRSEDRFRKLFDNMTEGFAVGEPILDERGEPTDWRFLEMNAAFERHTALERARTLNRPCREILPEQQPFWCTTYAKVALTGEAVTFEHYNNDLDRHFHVICYQAEADRFAVIFSDITERKRGEQALKAADRRKDEFLAMLAHELRNPLAPIRNAGELLRRMLGEDARTRLPLEMLARQTTQLTRLVDDLLDVARIAQGRITLTRASIEIGELIDHGTETVQPLLREKSHRLAVERPSERVYVEGDRTRLVQVLTNVLTNAAKYTAPGGTIRLEVAAADAEMTLRVIDNGCGISAELLPQIFDLFVQSERTLDRSQGGLGIGLSVVKRLIEMHHGSVHVASAGPGTGTTVVIRLPRVPAPPVAEAPAAPAAPARRILVIDDNRDGADSLAMLLSAQGHEVDTAYGAHAGIEAAGRLQPDVILLDVGLPLMDGYQVVRRLRQMKSFERTFIVALTGYGQAADRLEALAAGFDAHLVKPASPEDLARVCARSSDAGRQATKQPAAAGSAS